MSPSGPWYVLPLLRRPTGAVAARWSVPVVAILAVRDVVKVKKKLYWAL